MRHLMPAAVLLLALAGCSDDPIRSGDEGIGPAGGTGLPVEMSQPVRPKCADVFVPGKVIRYSVEQAAVGCLDPDGGVQIVGSGRCLDGGHLYVLDRSIGQPVGWGRDGEPYHAVQGAFASDGSLAKAYKACNG